MITAVDSSVLLDVLGADPRFGLASREALRKAFDSGALVACEIVWAETRAHFPNDGAFRQAFDQLGVQFDPCRVDASTLAGRLWRESRKAGSRRERVMADFMIGAHAQLQADA